MQQVSQVAVLVLSGLAEFFLADSVDGIIEVTLDMKVVENDQSVLCMLFDRGQVASGPITGRRLNVCLISLGPGR